MATEPMSPEWFRDKLYAELQVRKEEALFFDAYYTGNHPLPFVSEQARDEFRRIIKMTRSNYMGLVCDATAERAAVEGFRFAGDGENDKADENTWRIWQENNLDADSDSAWLEALICGRSFFLVAPNQSRPEIPNVWIEHASQCVIGYEPGTNRRVRKAALKVWDDDWTGDVHATLYLNDDGVLWLYKYQAKQTAVVSSGSTVPLAGFSWDERRVSGEEWPAPGQLDVVPMVEIANNARLLTGGVSELYDVTDIQDRVNKTLFDRMQTQEFGADPQKWAVAFPNEDDQGNQNTVEFGKNRMVTTNIAETEFGNFMVAPLSPYSEAKREDVKDIASRTRTPAQYLLGEMSNVNGETLKASESGLISKVRRRTRGWGEAPEEAMRIARRIANLSGPSDSRMETIWSDPQYRTEGERTDAAIKRFEAKIVPLRQTREDLGYTQTQIRRMEEADEEAALDPVTQSLIEESRQRGDSAPAGSTQELRDLSTDRPPSSPPGPTG